MIIYFLVACCIYSIELWVPLPAVQAGLQGSFLAYYKFYTSA